MQLPKPENRWTTGNIISVSATAITLITLLLTGSMRFAALEERVGAVKESVTETRADVKALWSALRSLERNIRADAEEPRAVVPTGG